MTMSNPTQIPDELQDLLRADGEGPAPRIDPGAARLLVEQAIDRATGGERVQPLRMRRIGWLLAAAFVLVGSAAAMYTALGTRGEQAAPRAATPRVSVK